VAKNPYPKIGTPRGDEIVGKCILCGKEQRRGDYFRVMLGDDIVCEMCYKSLEIFSVRSRKDGNGHA
jgi:hypothetical protein